MCPVGGKDFERCEMEGGAKNKGMFLPGQEGEKGWLCQKMPLFEK